MAVTKAQAGEMIWPQLQNAKFKEFYIDLLLISYQKLDRGINIFLVIVTSTSISAWAIWKLEFLQWLWAGLVALSQIVILIKPYLNYTRYIKELSERFYILQALNVEYEKLWFNLKVEKISYDRAYEKAFELKDALTKALKFSEGIILPDKEKYIDIAQQKVLNYLKTTFNYHQ